MNVAKFARRGSKAQEAVDEAIRKTAKVHRDRDGLTKCRVCSCTETRACNPPCSWVPGELDLCSTCEATALVLRMWLDSAYRPSMLALARELRRRGGRSSNAARTAS